VAQQVPERIVYHAHLGPATTRVTLEFFEQDQQRRMVLTQEGFRDENIRKIVSQGTVELFDKLDQILVGQEA
jgi:anti-sigma regulatory factor (Ser/Thr protein kinase)